MKWIRAWFWSRVRDNENWAQTLVRVLGNVFRILLTIVFVGAGLIFVFTYLENQKSQRSRDEARSVSVVAVLTTEQNAYGCTEMFPLALTVRNDSAKALMSMDIALSARRPGTSTNVLPYGQRNIRWDHIVPPGYQMTMCYMPPEAAPIGAVFSADPEYYSVRLSPPEQWMLNETNAARVAP